MTKYCPKCGAEWASIHECPNGGTLYHLPVPTPESIIMNFLSTEGLALCISAEDMSRKTHEEIFLRHLTQNMFRYFEAKVRDQCLAVVHDKENREDLN